MAEINSLTWIIITLLLIGFFAGMEIAFITANKLTIELKRNRGRTSGIILGGFLDHPTKFIGTVYVGYILFFVVYGLLIGQVMDPLWQFVEVKNPYLKLGVETLLSALLVLTFGEFLPRALFRAKADTLLYFFIRIFNVFHGIFQPIANVLSSISVWILKYIFNVRINEKKELFSAADMEHFLQNSRNHSEENQSLNTEMYVNALQLPNIKIRQCLVPRKEIEGIEIKQPIDLLYQKFINSKLSKLIVYEGNIDHIKGYVHQLDLFKKPTAIQTVLKPILVVPESMSVADLISEFTKERKSIAWVVDEFGGTAGIITMEDVLEEIFGEIKDEYDTEEFVEKQIADDEYIFSGRIELDVLSEKFGIQFEANDSETLSGYIIHHHETIPKQNEKIVIGSYQYDILNVSDTRIDMVKVKRLK